MKYLLIVLLLSMGLVTNYAISTYAGEKEDKETLIAEYKMLDERIKKATNAIARLKARQIEIQGALKYIEKKEKADEEEKNIEGQAQGKSE